MEILRVSESKLKIMLSIDEMKNHGLDSPELDYSDKNVRAAFFRLLDEARAAAKFETKGEKVLVQFYPASFGAEVFVTKLGTLSKSAQRSMIESDNIAMLSEEMRIYRFESLSDLVRAVSLNRDILSLSTEAYLSDGGAFYLITEERDICPASSFTEFGSELPKSLASYVRERARRIDRPIESLLALSSIEK